MKKLIWILFATALLFTFIGCKKDKESIPESIQTTPIQTQSKPTEPPKQTGRVTFELWEDYQEFLPKVSFDIGSPQSFVELAEQTPICVIATVNDIEIIELGTQTFEPLYDTIVKYTVHVDRSVNGDVTVGHTIYVLQNGYSFGDINIYHEYFPPLDYDQTYFMSIRPSNDNDDEYYFGSPFVSYPKVIDNKLYPVLHNRLFYEGQPIEYAIEDIRAAAYSIMPINLPIEQNIEVMTQRLINYDTPFIPVRDLTSEELSEFYDFDNSEFVTAVVGKEMENGYKFVWIKTTELDKYQQEDFSSKVSSTVKTMASELGIHCKVSTKPFDTLITLIGASEDNASLHHWFYDMLTREKYVQKIRFLSWEEIEDDVPSIDFNLPSYSSLLDLVEQSDLIFIGTLKEIRIKPDYDSYDGSEPYQTNIEYIVEYQHGYKDEYDYEQSSNIRITQKGFTSTNRYIYSSEMPPLEYGKTYLLLTKDNYLYSFETYPEVVDGKLYPMGASELFKEGMPLEEVISIIYK